MIPIYEISIPEYKLNKKIDYKLIGLKIDNLIKKFFPRRWIAVRGISLQDHEDKSIDEMVSIIKKYGTDKYNPKVKGMSFEIDKKFKIDFHATPMIAKDKIYCPHYEKKFGSLKSVFAEILKDFYEGAVIDRGYSVRLDILIIYNLDKLKSAPMKWGSEGPLYTEEEISVKDTLCYQFKNPKNKKDAILGIIRIN
ncbi:MAG: hypothetical protein PHQ66_01355 [Candidatus Nanoarchaeia archaeon]|nr:hypothetical protein [Candidatus Nanoarchaeia archaeon]MDD5357977.1 hypothetical protein [Candidatus Nanoarchaeia archaeon]MDD5588896.1 hypothetical protein [Candidatus Nanoarchaeia archaeon]